MKNNPHAPNYDQRSRCSPMEIKKVKCLVCKKWFLQERMRLSNGGMTAKCINCRPRFYNE